MGYSLEQFSAECHRILKQDPGVEGRKKVCGLVQQVLKDDAFVRTHLDDDVPDRKVLYEDPELGFCILGHVYHGAKDSNPHDHGPSWAIYGQARGETVMTDYEPVARPGEGKAGKARAIREYRLTPGMAYLYNEGDLHSPRREGSTRLIRIEGKNMEKVQRFPYDRVASRPHPKPPVCGLWHSRLVNPSPSMGGGLGGGERRSDKRAGSPTICRSAHHRELRRPGQTSPPPWPVPIKGAGTRSADSGKLSSRWRDIVAPLGGGCGLVEIGVGEAIEASAAAQNLAADLGGDAGIGQHPRRHLRETGVKMREIARHANVVGPAQQLDGGADLAFAALDRREAVALPIFERRQLQVGCVGIVVLAEIPLDAPQQPGNPPALSLQESNLRRG